MAEHYSQVDAWTPSHEPTKTQETQHTYYYYHSFPPPSTRHQDFDDRTKEERQERLSINRVLNPEDSRPVTRTRTTESMPESFAFQRTTTSPFHGDDRRTQNPLSRSGLAATTSREWSANEGYSDNHLDSARPLTAQGWVSSPQITRGRVPRSSLDGTTLVEMEEGEIQEDLYVDRGYSRDANLTQNGPPHMPLNGERVEQTYPANNGFNPEPIPSATLEEVRVNQLRVLLTIRLLCTNATRHFWQMKRPRPHLAIDIPSSRSIHRSTSYPERYGGDSTQTRHFHDERNILPWTTTYPEQGFTYADSLEELIWRISDQEWNQATTKSRDRTDFGAHAERSMAVNRMSSLYNWTQTVIQAVERVQVYNELLGRDELTDVLLAARDLAMWLLAEDEKIEIQRIWGYVIRPSRYSGGE